MGINRVPQAVQLADAERRHGELEGFGGSGFKV